MLSQPLASLLRPQSLKDFVGQSHLVDPQKPLRLAIDNHQIFSMIFWELFPSIFLFRWADFVYSLAYLPGPIHNPYPPLTGFSASVILL